VSPKYFLPIAPLESVTQPNLNKHLSQIPTNQEAVMTIGSNGYLVDRMKSTALRQAPFEAQGKQREQEWLCQREQLICQAGPVEKQVRYSQLGVSDFNRKSTAANKVLGQRTCAAAISMRLRPARLAA
jgi:hypothetical protein